MSAPARQDSRECLAGGFPTHEPASGAVRPAMAPRRPARLAVFKVGDRNYRIEPLLDRCFDFVLVSHATAAKQTKIDNKLTFATPNFDFTVSVDSRRWVIAHALNVNIARPPTKPLIFFGLPDCRDRRSGHHLGRRRGGSRRLDPSSDRFGRLGSLGSSSTSTSTDATTVTRPLVAGPSCPTAAPRGPQSRYRMGSTDGRQWRQTGP